MERGAILLLAIAVSSLSLKVSRQEKEIKVLNEKLTEKNLNEQNK